jgi:hypothetical protein
MLRLVPRRRIDALSPYHSGRCGFLLSKMSHTAAATRDYLAESDGWWRSRFTPVHASWLNQAELLLDAFTCRYLKRGSWESRSEFIDHVEHAWPEYNRRYAHPFEWTWTNQRMRRWYAEHES